MKLPLENCEVTSEYGIIRKDGKLHKGIDLISTSKDKNVKAIRGGIVRVTPYEADGFGNYISILQDDRFRALYCHLEKVLVKPGDIIAEGQIIGIEGDTGNSTGVHLHLELRKTPYGRDDHIDIAQYLFIKNEKGPVKHSILNYEEFEFLGILDFWRQGYRGQGIVVASIEDTDTTHGKKVADILKQILPEATILTGVKYYKEIPDKLDGYTTSLDASFDDKERRIKKAKEMYSKNVYMTTVVGNESYDGCSHLAKYNEWISIGACGFNNGKPKRSLYSSVTDYIDFVSLTYLETAYGRFNGTSCATPVLQSMAMLVQQIFKEKVGRKLTNQELINFIKDNCIDLEVEGHDARTGHGLFILPKPWNIDYSKYLDEEEEMPRYNTLEDVPEWGKATVEKLMNLEVLKGDENGNLNLSYDLLRTLVIHDRLGLYD